MRHSEDKRYQLNSGVFKLIHAEYESVECFIMHSSYSVHEVNLEREGRVRPFVSPPCHLRFYRMDVDEISY